MLRRLKNNFEAGIGKIKWFSSLLSERLKIEISIMKLLQQSEKMEKKREEKLKLIGQRVFELRNHTEKYILRDRTIMEAMRELERLDAEIEEIMKKASEISRVGA